MCAEAEALDCQCAQPQLASLFVELRAAEHVDALTVNETEIERVEPCPLHLHGEARAVVGILEREEDRRPALLAAELRHLTLHPDGRQPAEP